MKYQMHVITRDSQFKARVSILHYLTSGSLCQKHQPSQGWITWKDKGPITNPLKETTNLIKISVITSWHPCSGKHTFFRKPSEYIYSPMFWEELSVTPPNCLPRRRKQQSSRFENMCAFREERFMKQQFASSKDKSQRSTYFLTRISNPFLWITLLQGQGWIAVTRTWQF